jgi:hypothetical protein
VFRANILVLDLAGDAGKTPNDGLQLRRAILIQAEGIKLLEKDAVAPSAARLCEAAYSMYRSSRDSILCEDFNQQVVLLSR